MSDTRPIDISQADAAMSLKTWWALLFIYPLARPLTVFLVNRTCITPNQVTFCAMALRTVTFLCFLQGTRWGLIAGAVAYFLAYVCDCTDGTVARLTGKTSELGRYLDYCSELLSLTSKLAALYSERFSDSVILQAVDEVETLTTGLSRKIWQKIMILDAAGRSTD